MHFRFFFFTTTNSYFASSFSLAIPFLRSFSLSRDSCQSSFVFKHFLRAAFSTFPQFEKRQHSSTFDSFNYCLCYYFSSIQLSLESCKKISKNSQKKKKNKNNTRYYTNRSQLRVEGKWRSMWWKWKCRNNLRVLRRIVTQNFPLIIQNIRFEAWSNRWSFQR